MITINDFRYMRRGTQLTGLTNKDLSLLEPVDIRHPGHDRALLLLHGFSSSPAVYRYLIPQLTNYNAIVCPVLPGHGQSIEAFTQSKACDWIAKAEACCAELCEQYKQVDVLGLSLGGLLACKLSQRFKLHHLYLLAPALKLNMRVYASIKLGQVLNALGFHHLRSNGGDLVSNSQAEITYRKLPIPTIVEMLRLVHDYQWVAPTCPVDLFLGLHDKVVDSNAIEALFIPLANAKIHWLNHSAHVLPLDNDYDEIIQCVNEISTDPRETVYCSV